MAPTFRLAEPHPHIASSQKLAPIRYGRGGAGNVSHHAPSSLTAGATATGPASRTSISESTHSTSSQTSSTSTSTSYSSSKNTSRPAPAPRQSFRGIGGAGNARPAAERRIFSFDEELHRQARLSEVSTSQHVLVGRGGSGNVVSEFRTQHEAFTPFADAPRNQNTNASSAASVSSAGSVADRAKRSIDGVRGRLVRVFSSRE